MPYSYFQPWTPPEPSPLLTTLPLLALGCALAVLGGLIWLRRNSLMSDFRDYVTTRYGEPRATRELTPEDVFLPSPRAMRLWEDAGLVVDGELPTIRRSSRFKILAFQVTQPRLSQKKLEKAVVRLASFVTDPRFRTSPGLMDFEGTSVHVAFAPAL